MIRKVTLSRFLKSHSSNAVRNLISFSKSGDPEKLHQFRVEVKKMKAVFKLLKKHPGGGMMRRQFKPVDLVFKHAGQIRSLDVNMKLVSNYLPADDLVLIKNSSIREKNMKKFVETVKKYQLAIKKSVTLICSQLFNVDDYFFVAGINSKIGKIEKEFLRKKLRTQRLHHRRKQIKNVLFVSEVLPKPVLIELHINKKYLNNLQHVIGLWHDLELSHQIFMINKSPDWHLINNLLKEKVKLEQKIIRLTKNFKKKVKS